MEQFQKTMQLANGAFNEMDLFVGKHLVDNTYRQNRGYDITMESLSWSNSYSDEKLYKNYKSTKEEFWKKLKGLNKQNEKLYFQALKEFCGAIGYD